MCGDLLGQDHVVDTGCDEMASKYEQHAADRPYNAHHDRPAGLTWWARSRVGECWMPVVARASRARSGEVACYSVRFWREPLTSLCAAIAKAGFLIERVVEPLLAPSVRERCPEDWEKLQREPGFLVLRLVRS